MRLAKRTRKRGALDKALGLARARAARLAASPPLPARFAVAPHASERLRAADRGWVLVDCDASAGGTYDAIERARQVEPDSPARSLLLAADLFLHEAQIRRARHAGADAVLLVARVLPLERLDALAKAARALSMALAVEVHDEAEVAAASAVGADAVVVAETDRDTRRPDPNAAAVLAVVQASGIPVVPLDDRKLTSSG